MSKRPDMIGTGEFPATHEIHIFVGPVYVSPAGLSKEEEYATKEWQTFQTEVDCYKEVVKAWNVEQKEKIQQRDQGIAIHSEMKAPVLTLIFRDGKEEKPVTVCQSARYVRCNDPEKVKQFCQEDADWFTEHMLPFLRTKLGAKKVKQFSKEDPDWLPKHEFPVLRRKIEATAYGIEGIPQTIEDAILYPSCYFEFHIKVQRQGDDLKPELITPKEEAELRHAANVLSVELGLPIPLSYNREKNENNVDNGGCQRFLNCRFYQAGIKEIKPLLKKIKTAIVNIEDTKDEEQEGKAKDEKEEANLEPKKYKIIKVISEFVWDDDYKQMDHGWIDYSPEERFALHQGLTLAVQ